MSEDGGPAFPVQDAEVLGGVSIGWRGMSLRDAFAMAALPAIIQCATTTAIQGKLQGVASSEMIAVLFNPANYAKSAYDVADAMLAERKKRMT